MLTCFSKALGTSLRSSLRLLLILSRRLFSMICAETRHVLFGCFFVCFFCLFFSRKSCTRSPTAQRKWSLKTTTYSSTPLPRLHLSGRGGRHGPERRAHVPLKKNETRRFVNIFVPLGFPLFLINFIRGVITYPFSSALSFSTSIVSSSSLSEELKSWFLFIFQSSTIKSFSVSACCVCVWRASAQVCPERLRLKRSAFPRCHFNCGAGQQGRGSGRSGQSQSGGGFEWQRSWSKSVRVRVDNLERREESEDISLGGFSWKLSERSDPWYHIMGLI